MSWRYYAMRWTGEWLHRDLPLVDVSVTYTLSGPGGLTASLEPERADLLGPDGEPVIREWDTIILAEASGQLRGGGLVTSVEYTGSVMQIDCVGFSGYLQGLPLTTTLTWGGEIDGVTGHGVDPADVVHALWAHAQSQPDGNLGVEVDALDTPYRLGAWHNARRRPTEGDENPPADQVEQTPIPIDRVWTPQDSPPETAQGHTLYWEYRLPWYEDTELGAKIDELARQVPLEYHEIWEWRTPDRESVRMRLQLGYPRLGGRKHNLRFVEGENISEIVTIHRSGEDFANSVIAYGAGEGAEQVRESVSQRDGRLRRVASVDAPNVTSKAALRSIANDELLLTRQLTDIRGFVARDHPHAPVGSYSVGDDVLIQTHVGWREERMWVRITGISRDPSSSESTITCAASHTFRYDGGGQ